MKLLSLEIGERFRSLDKGFRIDFRSGFNNSDDETDVAFDFKSLSEFQPFCFAGLNGSGKSNVLEALSSIFFHLECCVAKFLPISFEKHFRREKCTPDIFELKYLINISIGSNENKANVVTISKEANKEPAMIVEEYGREESKIPGISLQPSKNTNEVANGKIFLPDIIVGYSSGENEILSLPFRKSRLINFDKYIEDYTKGYRFEEPENSLIYIDAEMSQAVLLVCLIYENEIALKPLKKELGIVELRSFRIHLNNLHILTDNKIMKGAVILYHINEMIEKLKKCSSCWNQLSDKDSSNKEHFSTFVFDFFVNDSTKRTFREHFSSSFELFRFLQVLYELNLISVEELSKEDIYNSKGVYTDWKIPESKPKTSIFTFLDYYIVKKIEGEDTPKELLLRELSDGEHQFLHTMGICLMLKERKSLLLLDEPETHFNPSWRAKFVRILSDSIEAGNMYDHTDNYNIHLLKDILLTSHSPFIISDCMPNNVIFFDRNKETKKVQAIKSSELGFNTYGTSIEIITDVLFKYNQSIGDLSNEELEKIDFANIFTEEDVVNAKKRIRHLGDSIEKDLVLARLNQFIPKTNK